MFLVFIGLADAVLSIARVKQRVQHGGRARVPRTLSNLRGAIALADGAFLLDNSSYDAPYRVVAVYREGQLTGRHPPLPSWTRGLPGL